MAILHATSSSWHPTPCTRDSAPTSPAHTPPRKRTLHAAAYILIQRQYIPLSGAEFVPQRLYLPACYHPRPIACHQMSHILFAPLPPKPSRCIIPRTIVILQPASCGRIRRPLRPKSGKRNHSDAIFYQIPSSTCKRRQTQQTSNRIRQTPSTPLDTRPTHATLSAPVSASRPNDPTPRHPPITAAKYTKSRRGRSSPAFAYG